MKIWVINQFAGHLTSGWGERHFYLAKEWQKEGHEVKIISGSFNHMFNNLPEVKGQFTMETNDGIDFCWVKCPRYNPKSVLRFVSMIVFAFKILFLPTKKLGKPDKIIVSSMPIFPILTAYFLKKRLKAGTLAFEIRDLWPLTPIELKGISKNHPMILFIGWLEKFGYRRSDVIVSLLPNAYKYINPISKDPEKYKWIPNGIASELMDGKPLPEDLIKQIPKDKFIIGYTGTIGMANALEYIIDAAHELKEHKDIFFILVGDGYLKEELMTMHSDQSNVLFLPRILKEQVQSAIDTFDVCFIGRNNTVLFDYGVSSNKYFDYMLGEKPVLVSSNKIKDPVELSDCGIIVQPESVEAIKEGVLQLYNMDKKQLYSMGKRGKEYVIKNYLYNELAKKYLDVLK